MHSESTVLNSVHPSYDPRNGLMKLRRISDGLVFERSSPDANEMVTRGGWELVPRETPSVRELLEHKSNEELRALWVAAGRAPHPAEANGHLVTVLVGLIEAGLPFNAE